MTEWKPRIRRIGLRPPFGYYPSPNDPNILLPDVEELQALEYSFRMRAKNNTSIRDCCMWLQANTGVRVTPSGYMYMYRKWAKKVKSERSREVALRTQQRIREQQEEAEKLFDGYTVDLDDTDSIYALAEKQASEKAS